MCAATITVRVTFPDGKTAKGAELKLINRKASDETRIDWDGITGSDGTCSWPDMDTGIPGRGGDIYDVQATYTDRDNGAVWHGKKTARVKKLTTIPVTLTESSLEDLANLKIDKHELDRLGETQGGKTVIVVLGELGTCLKNDLHHATIALTSYIIEGLIKLKLTSVDEWNSKWDKDALGQLLSRDKIKELLGGRYFSDTVQFNELRILAVHPKGGNSLATDVRKGISLMHSLLDEWYG